MEASSSESASVVVDMGLYSCRGEACGMAAISKRERTGGRTVLGAIGGHGSLQRKILIWDFWEGLAESETPYFTKKV
jgi:hypothetical protein